MRQQDDTKTTEIFPMPAKRGRKPTGQAKSGAEREAARRKKKAEEQAALLAELDRLKAENARLLADNQEMAKRLLRQEPMATIAGPLFDFLENEAGIKCRD